MSREHLRLPMHGRDHLPGGSDPIPALADLSSYTPDPAVGVYQFAGVTFDFGATVFVTWSYLSGTVLLNLSSPTAPTPLARGVYSLSNHIVSSTGWSAGYSLLSTLSGNTGTPATIVSANYAYALGDATNFMRSFSNSLTCQMGTADYFRMSLTNGDGAVSSRSVNGGQIYVQRLFTY